MTFLGISIGCFFCCSLYRLYRSYTLRLTAKALENRAFAKRNGSSSKNIHFQVVFAVAFREGKSCSKGGFCP